MGWDIEITSFWKIKIVMKEVGQQDNYTLNDGTMKSKVQLKL